MSLVKNDRYIVILVFILSLSLRLFFTFFIPATVKPVPIGMWFDIMDYNIIAQNIALGNGFAFGVDSPTAARPLLLPLLIGITYYIMGINYNIAVIIVIIISSIIPVLIYKITRHIFNQQAGIISAIIAVIYPPFFFHSGIVTTEIPFIAMLFMTILYLIRGIKGHQYNIALAGFLFGLTVLCRANALPLLAVIPFYLFLNKKKDKYRALKESILFVVCVAVTLSPWLCRNYMLYKGFPILQTNGGFALYFFGHNDLTHKEKLQIMDSVHISWEKKVRESITGMTDGDFIPKERPKVTSMHKWIIEDSHSNDLKGRRESINEYDIDRAFYKKAVIWMADNPKKMLFESAKNIVKFLWPFKARNKNYKGREINFAYIILVIFTTAGCYLSRNYWKMLLIIYAPCLVVFMTSVVFVHQERFRLTVEALLIIIAGYAMYNLFGIAKERMRKQLANGKWKGICE